MSGREGRSQCKDEWWRAQEPVQGCGRECTGTGRRMSGRESRNRGDGCRREGRNYCEGEWKRAGTGVREVEERAGTSVGVSGRESTGTGARVNGIERKNWGEGGRREDRNMGESKQRL